jgi:predicted Fe-S protein YdhL (DUF1289 family)
MNKQFIDICRCGDLKSAMELYENNDIDISDQGSQSTIKSLDISDQGSQSTIKSLDIHADNDWAFCLTCGNGHKDVAEWLLTLDGKINIHANDDYAFCLACGNGHKDVAEWLLTLSTVKSLDISDQGSQSTIKSLDISDQGSQSTIKSLDISDQGSQSTIKSLDIHVNHDWAFRYACFNGHKDVAEWLLTLGGIDISDQGSQSTIKSLDIHACDNYAFRVACGNGHKDVVKLLLTLDRFSSFPDTKLKAELTEKILNETREIHDFIIDNTVIYKDVAGVICNYLMMC